MSKYYTPETEEFHIGFEFEQNSGYEWVKRVFKDIGGIYNLGNAINQEALRVKHLDREDIESLGWEVNMKGYSGEGQGHDGPFTFERYVKGGYELMHFSDNTVHVFEPYDDQHVNSKFEGVIKNKSELKKLLNQLGI